MALGASYAGGVAVTGSSGPGISLKTEALGWGVMAEMPLIVCDIQRGGPSTGMPTNVEQSDLNIAVFGGHGDSPRVVLAPANVEDCFYVAIEAVNIARRYSVPVIILSDQGIATRIEAFPEPDLEKVCQDISPDLTPVPDHKPYDLSAPTGVTPHVAPGRAAGDSVSSVHIRYLHPLPPGLDNIFSGFNHVFVVEMNDEGLYGYGQLGGLLRARFCDPKIRGLNKTDGLTWKVRDILDRAQVDVSAGLRKR